MDDYLHVPHTPEEEAQIIERAMELVREYGLDYVGQCREQAIREIIWGEEPPVH